MELITTKEIKAFLSKRADECGYLFDVNNPTYQNITRLEAIKAHYIVLLEETKPFHPSLKPSDEQRKEIEQWIADLEDSYIKSIAPTVAKLSGAMITTHSPSNEVLL